MRLPRIKVPRAPAIMGLADGLTTGMGLVIGMSATRQHAAAIWAAGLAGGLSAFPGMASGRYQSDPGDGKLGAAACGLATTAGSVLVALPYAVTRGTLALALAIAIAAVLCAAVAVIRPARGWRAFALSYGITAAAACLCLAAGLVQGLAGRGDPIKQVVVKTGSRLWSLHRGVRSGPALSPGERAADFLKKWFGTWTALFGVLGAIAVWIVAQRTPGRWDPYPYILLNLCLSCLAAVQGIILQISANRGDRISAEVALHTQGNTDKLIAHGDQLYAINQQQLEILELLHGQTQPGTLP